MPHWREFKVADFAPRAWGGICGLVGGSQRVDAESEVSKWKDSFIVNLGTPAKHHKLVKPQELDNWHVDGDFFVHFLDSPEQGLLVIPLFTDIKSGGGGTMICPDAIPIMARHLRDHPDGVSPRMTPRAENPKWEPESNLDFFNNVAKAMPRESFVEVTGKVGDVFLLHPLMLHAASSNSLRNVRIITNPPVSLKEPMNFDREDESQYSYVERKTLRALGVDRLRGWKVTGSRDEVIPERVRRMARMKEEELQRLKDLESKAAGVQVAEVSATA